MSLLRLPFGKTAVANRPIRVKLCVLVVLNSGLALLLAGLGLLALETYQQRRAASVELSMHAEIIASSSTAALSFGDEHDATEILRAEKSNPYLLEGVIFDRLGRVFAHYERNASHAANKISLRPAGVYFENGALIVLKPIYLNHEKLGTLYLRATLDGLYARLARYVQLVFVVLLVSLAAALYFSGPVQRLIADPIADLSQVARRIASEKNYSVRAKKRAADEIGVLIDSFNEMLSKIETHELARKEAEASLRESEERYALAARGANDGLWDWKFATNTIHISSRWSSILGERAREGQCNPEDWFQRIHPLDRDRMKAAVAAHCEQKTAELSVEYRMQHRKGHFIWVLTRGVAVRDPQGVAIRMAGSQTDITEGKVADPLTGLPNRLYFLERLENAIEEAKDGKLCAVLFLDLDRFKLVNDSLGHAAGDELLMGIAERLRLSVREASASEFAGASVVSRLSGDEFAVLLDGLNETSEAATVAQLILKQLRAPFHLNGRQMFASVSIGIATGSSGCTPEDLLRNADTAMYYAKTKGKARFEIFDDTMRERALERLEIETDLREAIQLKQLVVYYQPKVCLRTRQVTGYEALVRWNHPRRGIIGPGEFVQVAEETDLIVPLGHLVLRESCRQMAEWHARFPKDLKPTVSVNVSFKQLNDGSLVEDVRQALAETGLDPQSLTLELTESTLMANPESASDTLRSLKELGVGLEIDDFGTGYSSLSYLNRLPFDTLKIDRSFVKELAASGESSEIIRTILELARSMNMEVVAEGVETHEQLQLLCELGSTYAQGFYFSKPLGPEATLVSMQQHHDFRKAFGYLQGSMPVDPLLESLQDAQIIEPVEVSG